MDQNIFREYDIRGLAGSQLTPATVELIAKAIGTFFIRNHASRIAIGFDARESSPVFAKILSDGLRSTGCDVVILGRVPTPVLYYAVFTQDVNGGVMITGSHNPPDHNGFKICLGKGALFGHQIREIGEIARTETFATGPGTETTIDILDRYVEDVVSRISLGPRRIRAVIDSGNGMGAVTAEPIYRRLGIEFTSLFPEPDASFPNHHPDPTVEENLVDLISAVRHDNVDVGIAFDGDADRIGVIDENGRILWGDELMVLFSRAVLAERPGSTIIGEVKCSQTLYDDIAAHGGDPMMWKAGHSLIKAKMKETGAVLAGEMSGHVFFADRYYGFDDAAYAGARLLEILSNTDQPLSVLTADLPKTFSTPELRVECSDDIKFDVVTRIAELFARDHEVNTIDGARIDFGDGWGLVRPSNTQAILVLRFEAATAERLKAIRSEVESRVAEAIELTNPLKT